MEQQQLVTMLSIEQFIYPNKSFKSHPKRRFIANDLQKLNDDEKMSDDVVALAMNIFDRFIAKSSLLITDRFCLLIALSSYNLAKKLRTNISINNENEKTSLILLNENYSDEDIFHTEQLIAETLDWDLSTVVPHDFIQCILRTIRPSETDLATIRSHVHILLSIALCELNTLTILPSVLCCACIKAAIRGLKMFNTSFIDEFVLKNVHCNKLDLIHIQRVIEELLQTHIRNLPATKQRHCLARIDTINKSTKSPRVK